MTNYYEFIEKNCKVTLKSGIKTCKFKDLKWNEINEIYKSTGSNRVIYIENESGEFTIKTVLAFYKKSNKYGLKRINNIVGNDSVSIGTSLEHDAAEFIISYAKTIEVIDYKRGKKISSFYVSKSENEKKYFVFSIDTMIKTIKGDFVAFEAKNKHKSNIEKISFCKAVKVNLVEYFTGTLYNDFLKKLIDNNIIYNVDEVNKNNVEELAIKYVTIMNYKVLVKGVIHYHLSSDLCFNFKKDLTYKNGVKWDFSRFGKKHIVIICSKNKCTIYDNSLSPNMGRNKECELNKMTYELIKTLQNYYLRCSNVK